MTPTIFLHGALGSSEQFKPMLAQFGDNQSFIPLNLPGHGHAPCDSALSMPLFADAVLQFLEENDIAQTDIFGYSMGGYVALWLAWKHPKRVRSVTTYGTKLDWTPEVAAGMARMFDPEKIAAKAPALAESLTQTHGADHWENLCRQTANFLHDLGNGMGLPASSFPEISCPVRIVWGELDHVVSREESEKAAETIPNGRFEVLSGGKHGIEQVDVQALAGLLA